MDDTNPCHLACQVQGAYEDAMLWREVTILAQLSLCVSMAGCSAPRFHHGQRTQRQCAVMHARLKRRRQAQERM